MGVKIVFTSNVFIDEEILPFISKDDVHFLSFRSADVGSEHHEVGTVPVKCLLIYGTVIDFEVPSSAVYVLLVLYRELNHEILPFG